MKQRNLGIDLLRAIALLCIILAHVNPPYLLWELRSFDVVMMVCISTISYTEFSKPKPYLPYIKGRFRRLLLPTWYYILITGVVFYLISILTKTRTPFPLMTILIGLVTFHGIGYLWIIRVFLYNAFLNPLIKKYQQISQERPTIVIMVIIASYFLYEIAKNLITENCSPTIQQVAEATILDFFAYGIIAICGFILYHFSQKKLLTSVVILTLVVSGLTIYNHAFNPNTYKYPPGLLYVTWGLLIVALSYYILKKVNITRLPRIIKFISENSLWIYFWHALLLNIQKYYYSINNWALNWFIVVLLSLILCHAQNIIIKKIKFQSAKKRP